MLLRTLVLVMALAACASNSGDKTAMGPDLTTDSDPSGDGDSTPQDTDDTGSSTDADGDGFPADVDCDDTDATTFPGAAEVCDGRDEDCSGRVDDGVPNDGAGCTDPGPPTFPTTVGVLHVTTRTGTGTNDGTDDTMDFCVSATDCLGLNKPEWDDLEPGITETQIIESPGLQRADIDRFGVETRGGSDRWVPTCFSMRLDGEPVYCSEQSGLYIGTEGSESATWTDPAGLTVQCTTCFDSPLTHGPVVGATTAESTTIWLRTDATRQVKLRVADSTDALLTAEPVAYRYPSAADDFTDHIEVFGLRAGTTWHYDVEVEGVRHGPWSFTTPPADSGPTRLKLAFGSCAKNDEQPIFAQIAAVDPDVFLFIGDTHYADSSDLAALRQYYRHARNRPLRRELLRGRTVLATWDDHDFTGNNTDGTAAGKDTALRAFREYQANGRYGTDATAGVFSAHRWGDVALIVLDDRYWRGLDDSILGDAQEAWLLDTLEASDATFKLLASGSQWTTDGSDDSWAAFPEAHDRFLTALVERNIDGVVLLSGDVHRSELRLIPGAVEGYDLPELTSSPLANATSGCTVHAEERACYDGGTSFILVDIDTSLADPMLEASLIDRNGVVQASWTIARSTLD